MRWFDLSRQCGSSQGVCPKRIPNEKLAFNRLDRDKATAKMDSACDNSLELSRQCSSSQGVCLKRIPNEKLAFNRLDRGKAMAKMDSLATIG
eukprot:scaffold55937_cov64-Cyclotella_meneghiniana.AAC.3